jgi:hypothetical protein
LPSWLTFAYGIELFAGTPTAADVGTISIEVTAVEEYGGQLVSDVFQLTVTAAGSSSIASSSGGASGEGVGSGGASGEFGIGSGERGASGGATAPGSAGGWCGGWRVLDGTIYGDR